MSYSKFNQALMFAGLFTLAATAALQGCSSDSTQAAPSGGAGKTNNAGSSNKAGATGKAGEDNGGDAGASPSGGTGNVGGDSGAPGEGGAGGEGGEVNPGCTDPLVCGEGTCDDSFDNSTLGLKNGKLPALP